MSSFVPVPVAAFTETVRALLAPGIGAATVSQAQTGHFFAADGARINRAADRLFVGAAIAHDGSTYGNGDWLSSGGYDLRWPVYGAQVAALSTGGTLAISGASRASDLLNSYGSLQTTIGVCGVAINDDVFSTSARHCTVYGGYFEAQTRVGSSGIAFGVEIDAVNFGSVEPAPTPYAPIHWPSTQALWLAAGGEHSTPVSDAAFAIGIKDNGAKFQAGIVFCANALTGCDGTTGYGTAMQLAKGHRIVWHTPAGAEASYITSTIATASNAQSIQFQDGGTTIVSADGHGLLSVQATASAVNGLSLRPAEAGSYVALEAFGADTNVGIALTPKGTSAVFVGGALTVNTGCVVGSGLTVNSGALTVSTGLASLQGLLSAGDSTISGSAKKVGFYGSVGTVKPTVSGSRGGNAALASLITALAGLGLVTDSTSA